jgi:hypothetical protein
MEFRTVLLVGFPRQFGLLAGSSDRRIATPRPKKAAPSCAATPHGGVVLLSALRAFVLVLQLCTACPQAHRNRSATKHERDTGPLAPRHSSVTSMSPPQSSQVGPPPAPSPARLHETIFPRSRNHPEADSFYQCGVTSAELP